MSAEQSTAPRAGWWARLRTSWVAKLASVALWTVVAGAVVYGWPNTLGGQTGYVIVSGNSMFPTYHSGDLVLTRSAPDYARGDVIVYDVPKGGIGYGMSVVHRVIGGDAQQGWVTQGDNNPTEDPWAPRRDDIRGRVTVHIPDLGTVLMFARSPLSMALIGSVVVGYILWPGDKTDEREQDADTAAPAGPDPDPERGDAPASAGTAAS